MHRYIIDHTPRDFSRAGEKIIDLHFPVVMKLKIDPFAWQRYTDHEVKK